MKEPVFEKYRVIKPLGAGGAGCVYLAENLHLDRKEAIKLCQKNAEATPIMYHEAEVLKQLSHPLLPVIYDFFEADGLLCIAMEYVEGMTLEAYLKQFGPVEEKKAVGWVVALTEVLGYLHEQKPEILYRDLKPSNIMVLPDGGIRLIDLGAACGAVYGQKEDELLAGTPGYSPPEQWQGGHACKESDIYALGMVLHEMLTGTGPVSGCQERRPVREYNKSISRRLETIILNCTKEQPADRYHSMKQLQSALRTCTKKERVREKMFQIRQIFGAGLFLLAAARTLLPFTEGVSRQKFPLPYMKEPLFLFGIALLYRLLVLRKNKEKIRKLERSVFLTEKKFPGLLAGLLLGVVMGTAKPAQADDMQTLAAEKQEMLWVELRDEDGRKCLLQEECAYLPEKKVWLEIAKEDLPDGESALKLIAIGEDDRVYESRVFLVENN